MQNWKNITLDLIEYDLEDAFNKISHLEVLSVTIEDRRGITNSNWFDDPTNPSILNYKTHKIVILLEEKQSTNQLVTDIQKILGLHMPPNFNEEIFEDKDWVQYTQSQFKEILISNSLRILPPWEEDTSFNGTTIFIEPGSGFGTGSHPTTKLCLKWIEKNLKSNKRVLDFGSGSGILSIFAKKITGNLVSGVEIDKLAIKNANYNNKINGMNIDYILSNNFNFNEKFDIVLSNILANILISLSNNFEKITKNELLLSGILLNQVDQIIREYKPWIQLDLIDQEDGWCLLYGKLKS